MRFGTLACFVRGTCDCIGDDVSPDANGKPGHGKGEERFDGRSRELGEMKS